jgi:hypothetical protein
MPSATQKLAPHIIEAFKFHTNDQPQFGALPRAVRQAFARTILPSIESFAGHDPRLTKRFMHHAVKMTHDQGARQNAIDTAGHEDEHKRRFKTLGLAIDELIVKAP